MTQFTTMTARANKGPKKRIPQRATVAAAVSASLTTLITLTACNTQTTSHESPVLQESDAIEIQGEPLGQNSSVPKKAKREETRTDTLVKLRRTITAETHSDPQSPAQSKSEIKHDNYELNASSADSATDAGNNLIKQAPVREAHTLTAEEAVIVQTEIHPQNSEKYAELTDNRTIQTAIEPVSTFSIDVDTGAYANIRRSLNDGHLPPVDAVRIEEMLNYFNYNYNTEATSEQPFSVVTEMGPTPWNNDTQLLHIGLQGYTPHKASQTASNLVFLIDVSGSMNSPDKLGLLKSSMSLLTQQLDANDTVSIVVYAGASGTVLQPTAGNQHQAIERALTRLQAGGSTNGAAGIELAYQLAAQNFNEQGTNRVILATDGDFNVGTSDTESLVQLIEQKRQAGIALTTLGFGTGNYNDHLMEQLADAGNGNYAYIDTLSEARKVLVDELTATLLTIAQDVKIQIEFNPATVSEYRLIGYTNRLLHNEDFNNDKVDAGEIGAGHSVTALYEIALKGQDGERHSQRRYGNNHQINADKLNEVAELRLRYKKPGASNSQLISQVISLDAAAESLDNTSNNFRFSASVAGFGQLLRNNTRLGTFDYDSARNLAITARTDDNFGYRAEYLRLVDIAQSLDKLKRAAHGVTDNAHLDDKG